MTDKLPENRWDRLAYSIGNVWDKFGRTDSLAVAIAINTALLLAGVAVWYYTSGILELIGAVWAILHVIPLGKAVANG